MKIFGFMKGDASRSSAFWGLLGAALIAAIALTRAPLVAEQAARPRELLAPPHEIQYFTFGHREITADLLWIRAIQDFDYCEKKINQRDCRSGSWLYQMLDVITDLSPDFRMAYSAGSMALTVIISDLEGASKFFDKAVAQFPRDWIINYKAAYHAIYEEKNPEKGARLVEAAAQNGAPTWVHALAGRLYTQAGQLELAELLARDLEASGGDPQVINAIRRRIREHAALTPPTAPTARDGDSR